MGGPNLLRSQAALSDVDGELITPIINGSRQSGGMPAIPLGADDAKAVAAFVRSVEATIGRQGTPPSAGVAPPSIVVGDAREGQAYFSARCASCHSVTGDLLGIASKIPDPKVLQNTWVTGGGRRGSGGGGGAPDAASNRTVTATVSLLSGERVEGRLLRIDDFLVTLSLADGTERSFRRNGDVPKVETHDPMKVHRDLLSVYTDKDIHDVTAYLVTLK
jgi:cytochrome c oxidase cbb3-type subunit 3